MAVFGTVATAAGNAKKVYEASKSIANADLKMMIADLASGA